VPLHELRHVDLDHRLFAAEHELGQRPHQLRLPDTGRAEEDERADRPTRVFQASPRSADRLGDHRNRLILALDPVVECVFHLEEPAALLLGNPHHRDAGPHRDNVRDVLGGDDRLVGALLGLPTRLDLLELRAELGFLVAVLGGQLVLLG
jgi:hypothetical protein